MSDTTSSPYAQKVVLDPEEKADLLKRLHEGKSPHDDGLFAHVLAHHGYGQYECQLHYTGSGGGGEDVFLMCLRRS